MNAVLATGKQWHDHMKDRLEKKTGVSFIRLKSKDDLSNERLAAINPRYVFFPHWAHIIPENIHSNYECVIFHMTDVPFGRGGSPLQNLIERGIYETRISALRCVAELDAGPVYSKRPLSLHGSAEEIFIRAGAIIEDMIVEIMRENPEPFPQEGAVVSFDRRKPLQSDISGLQFLDRVFDYIRMLDADGYPRAFLTIGNFKFEFSRAALKHGYIQADVKITEKK